MAIQSWWFTAATIGTNVWGGLCRRASLGILEGLAEGLADALELTGHAVPGKSLTRRDLLFRQILHELQAGDLEPRRSPRHDSEPLTVGREVLGARGLVRDRVPQRMLGVVLGHADIAAPTCMAAAVAGPAAAPGGPKGPRARASSRSASRSVSSFSLETSFRSAVWTASSRSSWSCG